MSLFLPMGLGLAGPMIVRPWDNLARLSESWNDYYGLQKRSGHPFLDAPLSEPRGGVVYFDEGIPEADFRVLLRCVGIGNPWKRYVVFVEDAADPKDSRYLTQMRVMSTSALSDIFQAISRDEAAALKEQPLPIADLLWTFVERESRRYAGAFPPELGGVLGGDGDWAKEALCFGLMVENQPWLAYRIWTRAWLVTK
jgi:hypothetical protein